MQCINEEAVFDFCNPINKSTHRSVRTTDVGCIRTHEESCWI